jgi:hypothetical protein
LLYIIMLGALNGVLAGFPCRLVGSLPERFSPSAG